MKMLEMCMGWVGFASRGEHGKIATVLAVQQRCWQIQELHILPEKQHGCEFLIVPAAMDLLAAPNSFIEEIPP
ncbi:MAG: hypothetical protein WBN83_17890 [Desulfoprunum sp.]|jgi:hypothetical protein|uniref:hypothetical protein n=1 Tax=Desulfoprunum sp. TaxID=2020866 RepID=UPI00052BCC10|nr:hypothetical protein JT06_08325 [Desulfobulbus sp. Tol-SR]